MSSQPAASTPPNSLAELRARIDRIDAEVHELLIARSQIIEALIRVKKTVESGAAFRPGREASMMHALVERHRGGLPLVTVEHVWREVISTFTWLQAHYTVYVSADDDAETRDIARFYFGFTVPFVTAATPFEAIAGVAKSVSDLAVIRLGPTGHCWWRELDCESRPRIIGRLPFLEIPERPVATPAVVISNALADPVSPEMVCFVLEGDVSHDALKEAGFEIIAFAKGETVVAREAAGDPEADLTSRFAGLTALRPIGGYARPIACPKPCPIRS